MLKITFKHEFSVNMDSLTHHLSNHLNYQCFHFGHPVFLNWLQAVYDAFFISTYNVFYTSMPVIVMGIFDQDVDDTASLRYGSLFSSGMNNELFNRKLFAMEAIKGLLSSLILSGFAAGNLKFITLLLTVWKFKKYFCQNRDLEPLAL